jgi:1,4-dihydroxy-2-naphthoate octaprenyltransferase
MKKKILIFIRNCLILYVFFGLIIFVLVPFGNTLRVNIFGLFPAVVIASIIELAKYIIRISKE